MLPHALIELTAVFLPLAAWLIASRRDEWGDLLAATFVTVAIALPMLLDRGDHRADAVAALARSPSQADRLATWPQDESAETEPRSIRDRVAETRLSLSRPAATASSRR